MEENKINTVENENKVEGTGNVDTQTTQKNEGEEKMYSQKDAQQMADAMLAKKLKGMPTKEELQAFKDWKESQKTEEQKKAEADALNAKREQEHAETKKELAVYKAGVNSEEVDFVIFKVSKMDGDFEENLEKFLRDNPKYLKTVDVPAKTTTGLPTEKIADKGESGVTAILRKKHPELYK